MALLRFLWVGKTQRGFVQEGVEHYLQRIQGFIPAETVEVRAADHSGRDPAQAMRIEAEALLKRIGDQDALVVLDERGTTVTSPKLAERIKALREQGTGTITFVVGGAYGLDESIRKKARMTLSLSALTFPHQLVRVILLEQVYRALTINAGLPYHHGNEG
jgi:23S rRNA (pseudouridine1915-N3)-methyltransferase